MENVVLVTSSSASFLPYRSYRELREVCYLTDILDQWSSPFYTPSSQRTTTISHHTLTIHYPPGIVLGAFHTFSHYCNYFPHFLDTKTEIQKETGHSPNLPSLQSPNSQCVCVCVCALLFSCVWLFEALWTVAHQALQSMGFPRQEY